jgi:catechol 2,3-dioxygenase-like lactoylglutathione lyase family enzyme
LAGQFTPPIFSFACQKTLPENQRRFVMIKGVHTMIYSSKPEELRAFIRDKLGFSFTDVGDGWLVFDLPEADMGCHPADPAQGAPSGTHNISFYCDDIHRTIAVLKGRGVEFTDGVKDEGYGLVTHFRMPGDFAVQLYQPRYSKNR